MRAAGCRLSAGRWRCGTSITSAKSDNVAIASILDCQTTTDCPALSLMGDVQELRLPVELLPGALHTEQQGKVVQSKPWGWELGGEGGGSNLLTSVFRWSSWCSSHRAADSRAPSSSGLEGIHTLYTYQIPVEGKVVPRALFMEAYFPGWGPMGLTRPGRGLSADPADG